MTRFEAFLFFVISGCAGALGCGGDALDAGRTQPAPDGGVATSPASGSGAGSTAPTTPIAGHVAAAAFEPETVEIQYSEANSQWFLTLRNYPLKCGRSVGPEKPVGSDKIVVAIGKLPAKAGEFEIDYGDGHAASFQVGVYEAGGPDPDYSAAAKEGAVWLDRWSETPGETVKGWLRLKNDESDIAGTFTATICAAR